MTKTTTSSTSAEMKSTNAASKPPRRRGRPRKPTAPTDPPGGKHSPPSSPEPRPPPPPAKTTPQDEKRAKLRGRNREAAHKCRMRKQRGVDDLQAQEAVVETVHDALMAEATHLRSEVLVLKNMILQHGGCGCSFIENYIHSAACNMAQQELGGSVSPETGASPSTPYTNAGGNEFRGDDPGHVGTADPSALCYGGDGFGDAGYAAGTDFLVGGGKDSQRSLFPDAGDMTGDGMDMDGGLNLLGLEEAKSRGLVSAVEEEGGPAALRQLRVK